MTLVEMTVVIAVIAVAAAMFVPPLTQRVGAARLRESARHLLFTARRARDYAVTHCRACRLRIDEKERSYEVGVQPDPQHEPQVFEPSRNVLAKPRQLEPGVKFALVLIDPQTPFSQTDGTITFMPNGGADAAVIQMSDDRRVYSLMIEPNTGRIELRDRAEDQLPNDRRDLDLE